MKKILITGGDGFFGSRLQRAYRHRYHIVSTGRQTLNILDKPQVFNALKLFRPDYVIHTAAIAVTDYCNQHPEICREINVTGSLNVAEACRETYAKMVFISSEQVFNGNQERGPYSEDDIAIPDTVYGKNKLESETLLKELLPELWILRFTWLFGLPERNCSINANIVWDTIQAALKGERQKVTCNEYRGYTNVYDVINQFYKVFDLPYGTYHLGSENDLNRYKIVCFILNQLGIEHRTDQLIEKDAEKYHPKTRDIRLATDKIKAFGFEFPDSRLGIEKLIKDYQFNLH